MESDTVCTLYVHSLYPETDVAFDRLLTRDQLLVARNVGVSDEEIIQRVGVGREKLKIGCGSGDDAGDAWHAEEPWDSDDTGGDCRRLQQ